MCATSPIPSQAVRVSVIERGFRLASPVPGRLQERSRAALTNALVRSKVPFPTLRLIT